ncbi:MAG: F0F1 ATP synthase subunit epsilon [Fimbriimonadales bacterium]|nr:F0F1 ATP synthase subunit epsilon [Fimbriimonadales bacterium]
MASTFQLSVVAPDKTVIDELTDTVIAPGVTGYLGVQAQHEPFITQLRVGVLEFRDAGGTMQKVAIAGGFLETDGEHVIVLADAAERSGDIDRARAMAAAERAKQRLQEKSSDLNLDRATAALERAANRIKLAGG